VTDYDASSIQILSDAKLAERWHWLKAAELAKEYPTSTQDFIRRLLEAAEMAGWPHEQAIARYLRGDRSVSVPPEMLEIFTEAVRAERFR